VAVLYLGSIDQYEEYFQFILDLINLGSPCYQAMCILYIYTHTHTHTHTPLSNLTLLQFVILLLMRLVMSSTV